VSLIDIILFALLAATAVAIIRLRDLFASVMLLGIFSLLSASLFVVLDAVDVAFTEASVGAGVSTILMLATLAKTRVQERDVPRFQLGPFILVAVTGAFLIVGTLDMPPFGDPADPIHHHVAPRYIEESPHEIGIPNIVTSVLASYRGYDTFGETTVIFTAAIGVLLLLGHRNRHHRGPPPPKEEPL
jgi:multicomponent Na+:H+ antiporter subunit B